MNRFDLQVHTDASPCSRASPGGVVEAAVEAGLDGLAVTDHDTIENVDSVEALAPPDLTVVPGVEVTTSAGHLLALDVREAPPTDLDPLDAVGAIQDRGGIAVLSHPFDVLREHYEGDLARLAAAVDGVEAVNSRCLRAAFNERAGELAARRGLAVTGGSDAHFPMEVGRAHTAFEGPLREAITDRRTRAVGRGRFLTGHVATKLHQAAAMLGV